MYRNKKQREISMNNYLEKDRIDGDTIIIYDDSGPQYKILRHIKIILKNEQKEYTITKTRNNKYQMQ